ncbi:MAG: MmcB family DNA repair protein [Alphaproteobacteria bacterium]
MSEPSERSADDLAAAELTVETTRGVGRHLVSLGYAVLTEFTLANNRRADVIGLSDGGTFAIVEVKVSVADLRGDTKWPEYEDFCDRLYFAVPPAFPNELVPERAGLIIADSWGGEIVREAPETGLHASRRKALTLRFARAAAQRHQRLVDPRI